MRKEQRFNVRQLPIGATLAIGGDKFGKIDAKGILHVATYSTEWVNTKQTLDEYNTVMVQEKHEFGLSKIIYDTCNRYSYGQIRFGRQVYIFKSRKKYRHDQVCYRLTYQRPSHKGYYGHGIHREKRYLGGESWEIDLKEYPQFLDLLKQDAEKLHNMPEIFTYTLK